MQGDLYVNLRVAPKVFIYLNLNKGVSSGFDAFALLNVLPGSGHLKIGRFIPDYGTNLDDPHGVCASIHKTESRV